MRRILALALGLALLAIAPAAQAKPPSPRSVHLQNRFDPIGPEVRSLTTSTGRTAYYIDEGRRRWRPVVFLGGQGTSLEAFQLTEFARTSRERLRLRAISVERNGFGESRYDPKLGYEDYVNEVLEVLRHLHIRRFAIVAISGGGPYAAHLAARVPQRVISLHLAAASGTALPSRPTPGACSRTPAELNAINVQYTHFPKVWWFEPPEAPVHLIPGWQTVAYNDAARAFFVGGQLGAPDALTHEYLLPCSPNAIVGLSKVKAPAYLYWGAADTTVPTSVMELWAKALPHVAAKRVYRGEGHTVQYRHWDQILVDMAGLGRYTVVCRHGHTRLLTAARARRALKRGATLGICAWATAAARR